MEGMATGSVDLAFADPPFNIGYEYDVYDDRKGYEAYLDWTRKWTFAVARALKPTGTFWIAIGDEYAAAGIDRLTWSAGCERGNARPLGVGRSDMGRNSAIEWTHHTFNPWIGCSKVAPECQHCYAEQLMDLRLGKVTWGPSGTRQRTSEHNWRQPIEWNREARAGGARERVFCASLADVFEDCLPNNELDEWRKDLWRLIGRCDQLDWLLLTKRPENIRPMLCCSLAGARHVWLGTSAGSQASYDRFVPALPTFARVRFLSCEPMLGPVKLRRSAQDWVICGGESGPHARPMDPDWARSLRDQCQDLGIPFFFKQWGEHDARGRRVGKKSAGRLLDGRTWDEVPEVRT